MTRRYYIEQQLRQVFGGYNRDDSEITINLVNSWIPYGTALAAQKNYRDVIQLDGIGYLNNSFYTTYKGIAVTKDENFLYKVALPHIPVGIGRNEGVENLVFKDTDGNVSLDAIPLSEHQKGYFRLMRPIPNKLLYYPEGGNLFVSTTIILTAYTASVTMISAGDSTNLDSTLNLPDDYFPILNDYIKQQLMTERLVPQDQTNQGSDEPK